MKSSIVDFGSINVTCVSRRAEDRRVFDADDAGADDDHRTRQILDLQQLVAVENGLAVEGHVVGAEGLGADGKQDAGAGDMDHFAIVLDDLHGLRIDEARLAANMLHAIASELMLRTLDFMVEGDQQAATQILGADFLLDAIGAPVEATLAPAGEIERGFAQRLRREWCRYAPEHATDTLALLDHKNLLAELCGLNGASAAGGATAHD